jgi:hypothetical protein
MIGKCFLLLLLALLLCTNRTCRSQSTSLPDTSEVGFSWMGMQLLQWLYNDLSLQMNVDLNDEAILLQRPGLTLDGRAFDDDYWRRESKYSQASPASRRFDFADMVLAPRVFAVEKSDSIAELRRWMFASYQWADEWWENEMCQLLQLEPLGVESLFLLRRKLLASAQRILDDNDLAWKLCTRERRWSVCAEEQLIRDEKYSVRWRQYEHVERLVAQRRAKFDKLFTRHGDLLMTAERASGERARRADLGETGLFEPYFETRLEPHYWWLWFAETTRAEYAPGAAFIDPSTGIDRRTPPDSLFRRLEFNESYVYQFSNGFVEPHPNWLALGGVDADSSGLLLDVADRGRGVAFQLDVARVDIERPWLDESLLAELAPLAMRSFPVGGWSNGQLDVSNTGVFPLLATGFVVARHICFTAAEWEPGFLADVLCSTLTEAQLNATADDALRDQCEAMAAADDGNEFTSADQLLFGPFTVVGDTHFFADEPTTDAHVVPIDNGFCIEQPQIIAWIAKALPLFPTELVKPNFDLLVCNRSALTPGWPEWVRPNLTDLGPPIDTLPPLERPSPTPTPDAGQERGVMGHMPSNHRVPLNVTNSTDDMLLAPQDPLVEDDDFSRMSSSSSSIVSSFIHLLLLLLIVVCHAAR